MNILFLMPHVIEAFSKYGVSLDFYKNHKSFEHRYARLFLRHGHKATVAILSNSINAPLWKKHVFGHEYVLIPVKGLKFIRQLNASICLFSIINESFDLIHCFSYYSNFYDMLSINANIKGVPLVAQAQSIWKSPPNFVKFRKFFTLRYAKHLVPMNKEEMQNLMNTYRIPMKKITLVPNFIEFEDMIIKDKFKAREFLNINKEDFLILSVARLEYNKGLDILLKAFSKVLRIFTKENFKLVIVGEGPEKAYLKKLAEKLRITNLVVFTGFQPNEKVQLYYDAADIFVLPSREESFGIVLLEAMAHKLPLIGADNGGIKDIIRPGMNGLLFKTGDVNSLISALIYLIKNEEERINMGNKGAHLVWLEYNSEKIYSILNNIYTSIIRRE
ncbi:MAG: glycosyltransferase family 4 protein [Candidatus Aenigmatarchaeota archaeon]